MRNQDQLRGTGRTTRMIREAIRLADAGRYVFVVAESARNAADILIPMTVRMRSDAQVVGSLKVYIGNGEISF